jgi:hypothetical protein
MTIMIDYLYNLGFWINHLYKPDFPQLRPQVEEADQKVAEVKKRVRETQFATWGNG